MKIVKSKSKDVNLKSIQVRYDGGSTSGDLLIQSMNMLIGYKDQVYLKEAFKQNNVGLYVKIGKKYHPLTQITEILFNFYKNNKSYIIQDFGMRGGSSLPIEHQIIDRDTSLQYDNLEDK